MASTQQRTLTSKRLRNLLYLASDGLCAKCGCELASGWHAHHAIAPYHLSGRTEFSEMRAYCPACNLKVGANLDAVEPIKTGRPFQDRTAKMAVTDAGSPTQSAERVLESFPGAGKTGAGILYANTLLHLGIVSAVLWFVPRRSLCTQIRDGYHDRRFHVGGRERQIKYAERNSSPLFHPQDYCGVVQTYDSLRNHLDDLYLPFVRRNNGNVVLIFDEMQCLADDDDHKTLACASKIWQACRYRLGLSGLLLRGDGHRVPFVKYLPGSQMTPPRDPPDLLYPAPDIRYTLREAIADMAVRQIEFHLSNGHARFELDGELTNADISAVSDADYSKAMDTFLNANQYQAAFQVVSEMLSHWKMKRDSWNYPSRFLVVANDIAMAQNFHERLAAAGYRVCISTTEHDEQNDVLDGFRTRAGNLPGSDADGLISVGKAYIGLDIPDATHMAYLRNFRTPSYMVQAAWRIGRIDYKMPLHPGLQAGFFFAPNDPRMQAFRDYIRTDIQAGLEDRMPKEGSGRGPGSQPDKSYTRIDAAISDKEISSMNMHAAPDMAAQIEALQRADPRIGKMPADCVQAILERVAKGFGSTPPPAPHASETPFPSRQHEEDADCKEAQKLIRKAAGLCRAIYGEPPGKNWFQEMALEVQRRGNLPRMDQRSRAQHAQALKLAAEIVSEKQRIFNNR